MYFSFYEFDSFPVKIRQLNASSNKVFRLFQLFRFVLNNQNFQFLLNLQFTHDGANFHLNKGHFSVIKVLL